jgi:hypothetical protein
MEPVLWDVKMDSMETSVTTLVHCVQRDVIGAPAIVRERVQMANTEIGVIYNVVRIVQVDAVKVLVCVIAAASSEILESTVVRPVTLDVWLTVIKTTDDVHVNPDGKERNVTVRTNWILLYICILFIFQDKMAKIPKSNQSRNTSRIC